MLDTPFGLNQIGFEYPWRSPTFSVLVTPALKRTWRYYPPRAYLMFGRYLTLIKALHVD